MINVRCIYCGTIYSLAEWQRNNRICIACNVSTYERRLCIICNKIFAAKRQDPREVCSNCTDIAIAKGLLKARRQPESPKGTKNCLFCGKPFEYIRSNALYCSEQCRKRLENRRRMERKLEFVKSLCQKCFQQ